MNRITLIAALLSVVLASAGWSQQQTSKAQTDPVEATASSERRVVSTRVIQSEAPASEALIMVRDAESGELRAPTHKPADRARLGG